MADYDTLAAEVEKLSLPELSQFVKFLEERWGVSAAAPMMMGMPMGAGGGAAEPVAEQTEFDVMLDEIGANKIQVIKAVREVNPTLGLKEAKDVVESAPTAILSAVTKDDAANAKKVLEDAGAKASVK